MARLRFAHDDFDRQAAWVAEILASPFTRPTRLPLLTKKPEPKPEPQPTLFDLLDALKGDLVPPTAEEGEDVPGACNQLRRYLMRIGAIDAPSPLAMKRRKKAAEREEAARAAFKGPTVEEALAKLVEARLTTPYLHSLGGGIHDKFAGYIPRSCSFPVKLDEEDGKAVLRLSTPATGSLPFVHRIEELTGLKAAWRPDQDGTTLGQWHHAVDLADDKSWQRLTESMQHTTPELVARVVGMHVTDKILSARKGRLLLTAIGVEEPRDRSEPEILAMQPGYMERGPAASLSGWGAVHAFEDKWLVHDRAWRACFTAKARERLGLPVLETPVPEPKRKRSGKALLASGGDLAPQPSSRPSQTTAP